MFTFTSSGTFRAVSAVGSPSVTQTLLHVEFKIFFCLG